MALAHAFTLVDEIARHGICHLFWTFGGGTVLMLRHGHRLSKDIDIFAPDALQTAALFLIRHRDAFLAQIRQRRAVLGTPFEAIDALGYRSAYDEAVDRVSQFLIQLPA